MVNNVANYSGESVMLKWKTQHLMLNPPVLVVLGAHVAFMGLPRGLQGDPRVNMGALRTLQLQNPKIQSIILRFCNFFANHIQAQQPFSDAWNILGSSLAPLSGSVAPLVLAKE
jgi:hypothetical protein